MMDNGWGNGGWGWGAWVLMAIMMVIFFALIAAVVVALIGRGSRRDVGAGPQTNARSSGALLILDERFARGEIDADEYSKRRELLRSQ